MKKILLLCLSFLSALLLSFAAACSSGKEGKDVTLTGFEAEKTINVSYGELFEVPQMLVQDTDGNYYDVEVEVFDGNNKKVAVYSGSFTISETTDYKIVYTINANGVHKTLTTTLRVDASGVSNVRAESDRFVEVGDSVEVTVSEDGVSTYALEVTHKASGTAVEVNGRTFVPTQAGVHTVTVTATNGENSTDYTYTIFAQAQMREGEIEVFDENWYDSLSYSDEADGRMGDWSITSTEETGIKNRFGESGTYAKMTTSDEFILVHMGVRGEQAYYKQLAKEGYQYVSFWLYIQSPKNLTHLTYFQMNEHNAAYRINKGNIASNRWVQLKMPLVPIMYEDMTDYQSSFVEAYDKFKSQMVAPILIDNSDAYNKDGREKDDEGNPIEFNIYFGDIYAVKDVSVSTTEKSKTPSVDETVELSEYFRTDGDMSLQYALSYREQTVSTDDSHTFTKNGEYVLSATTTSAQPHINGKAEVLLNVQDINTLSAKALIKERTGESLAVSFAELETSLTKGGVAVAGATPTYTVSWLSQAVDNNAQKDGFTATKDGCYTVEVDYAYPYKGKEYHSVSTTTVDVWTEENKYAVVPVGEEYIATSMLASSGYINRTWAMNPTMEIVSAAGGKTGSYYKTSSNAQFHDVYIRPIYSKHYYETLYAQDSSYVLSMQLYHEDISGSPTRSYTSLGTQRADVTLGGWEEVSISLKNFLGKEKYTYTYDYFTQALTRTNEWIENGYVAALLKGYLVRIGSTGALWTNVYVGEMTLMKQASQDPVVTKASNTVPLETATDLHDYFTVQLGGLAAEITSIKALYNDEYVYLSDGAFTPVYPGEYTFEMRAVCTTADGATMYRDFTATLTAAGTPLTPTTMQITSKQSEIALGTLIEKPAGYADGYEFQYDVYRKVGSDTYALETGMVTADATFDFADHIASAEGSFVIVYTLSKTGSTSSFAALELHKVYVDVCASDTPVYQNYQSENIADYVYLWNWSTKYTFDDVAEVTGEGNLRFTSNAQSAGIHVLPLYSKAYYEKLRAQGYTTFTFEMLLELEDGWNNGAGITPDSLKVNLFSSSWNTERYEYQSPIGEWQRITCSIDALLSSWDKVQTTTGGVGSEYKRSLLTVENWVNVGNGEDYGYDDSFTLTITPIQIVKTATVSTATVEFASDLQAGVGYDLSTATVKLDGNVATSVRYSVDETTGIRIENGKLFADIGAKYALNVSASAVVNGTLYSKTFTQEIEVLPSDEYTILSGTEADGAVFFETLGTGYNLKALFEANGTNTLKTGDSLAYNVYKVNGAEKTLISGATVMDGVLQANGISAGRYYVEIYVARGVSKLRVYTGWFNVLDKAAVDAVLAKGTLTTFDDAYATEAKTYNSLTGAFKNVKAVSSFTADGVTKTNLLAVERDWTVTGKGYFLLKTDVDLDILRYLASVGYTVEFEYTLAPETDTGSDLTWRWLESRVFDGSYNGAYEQSYFTKWKTVRMDLSQFIATQSATKSGQTAFTISSRTTGDSSGSNLKALQDLQNAGNKSHFYITALRLVAPQSN